jgi:hypothetical protein
MFTTSAITGQRRPNARGTTDIRTIAQGKKPGVQPWPSSSARPKHSHFPHTASHSIGIVSQHSLLQIKIVTDQSQCNHARPFKG